MEDRKKECVTCEFSDVNYSIGLVCHGFDDEYDVNSYDAEESDCEKYEYAGFRKSTL